MEKPAAGRADEGFPGEKARADVVAVLDVAGAVVDGHAVADGIEYRLEFARLGAQPQVGGFQFLDLLLDLGVKTDLGAFQPEEPVETCLIDMGTLDFAHQYAFSSILNRSFSSASRGEVTMQTSLSAFSRQVGQVFPRHPDASEAARRADGIQQRLDRLLHHLRRAAGILSWSGARGPRPAPAVSR